MMAGRGRGEARFAPVTLPAESLTRPPRQTSIPHPALSAACASGAGSRRLWPGLRLGRRSRWDARRPSPASPALTRDVCSGVMPGWRRGEAIGLARRSGRESRHPARRRSLTPLDAQREPQAQAAAGFGLGSASADDRVGMRGGQARHRPYDSTGEGIVPEPPGGDDSARPRYDAGRHANAGQLSGIDPHPSMYNPRTDRYRARQTPTAAK
jgi:hypothetical protein